MNEFENKFVSSKAFSTLKKLYQIIKERPTIAKRKNYWFSHFHCEFYYYCSNNECSVLCVKNSYKCIKIFHRWNNKCQVYSLSLWYFITSVSIYYHNAVEERKFRTIKYILCSIIILRWKQSWRKRRKKWFLFIVVPSI